MPLMSWKTLMLLRVIMHDTNIRKVSFTEDHFVKLTGLIKAGFLKWLVPVVANQNKLFSFYCTKAKINGLTKHNMWSMYAPLWTYCAQFQQTQISVYYMLQDVIQNRQRYPQCSHSRCPVDLGCSKLGRPLQHDQSAPHFLLDRSISARILTKNAVRHLSSDWLS